LAGGDDGEGELNLIVHPSPSQRLSLRGMSPSGAEPEPAATPTLPYQGGGWGWPPQAGVTYPSWGIT